MDLLIKQVKIIFPGHALHNQISDLLILVFVGEFVPHSFYCFDVLVADLFTQFSNVYVNRAITNNNSCTSYAFKNDIAIKHLLWLG